MNYIDVNVFVYATLGVPKDRKAWAARSVIQKIAKAEMHAMTSFLSWDEFVWVVRKIEGPVVAKEKGRELMAMPNLKFCVVDGLVVGKAQELIETYNLQPRDALHAASAITNNIECIISDDVHFDIIKDIRRMRL
jgi:predicted nucleic acid-binding protein